MKKTNHFTLQQYSALAGVLLLIHDKNNAQAVYTDINPDIVLQFDNETAGVDMDNDGTFDFAFLKSSGYFSDLYYSSYGFFHNIFCGPYGTPANEVAGDFATNGSGGAYTYHPFVLYNGYQIDELLSWQNYGYQLMANGFYIIEVSMWDWHYGFARWSPSIDSSYLGVRFIGGDDCLHYGWIRCSTVDSAKTLIVHDFAYETKCNTPIIAGDTIGDTTTVGIENLLNLHAEIFAYNNHIYIRATTSCMATVYDSNGRKIIDKRLPEGQNTIDMSAFPNGIYIVKLTSSSGTIAKTISL